MMGLQMFQCFFLGVKETVKACVRIEYRFQLKLGFDLPPTS
jgi:hypothetical protein